MARLGKTERRQLSEGGQAIASAHNGAGGRTGVDQGQSFTPRAVSPAEYVAFATFASRFARKTKLQSMVGIEWKL